MEVILAELKLIPMVKYLNDNFPKKQSRKKYNTNDVFQYARLGHVPYYVGGNRLERKTGKRESDDRRETIYTLYGEI